MTDEKIVQKVEEIRSLKIQGARNVAKEAISSLKEYAENYDGNEKEFFTDFVDNCKALMASRPTEPMMRNGIRYIIYTLKQAADQPLNIQKETAQTEADRFLDYADEALRKIAEIGAKRIPNKSIVMIHCHSSTVMAILKEALDQGKKFEVVCTETRPMFQGHKSAKELSQYGIPVTLIVDSAMRTFLKKADMVLVGSDAICANGDAVNKIGTSMLAVCANELKKPFMVATEGYKFDPETVMGVMEPIEERPVYEIADPNSLEDVQIRNPAFDITPAEYIDLIITEDGVMSPSAVYEVMHKKFAYMFNK